MCENSLIHSVNVKLDLQKTKCASRNLSSHKYLMKTALEVVVEAPRIEPVTPPQISIVEQILADFSEFDNECPSPSPVRQQQQQQNAIDGCEINNTRHSSNVTLINNNATLLIQPKTSFDDKKTEEEGEKFSS